MLLWLCALTVIVITTAANPLQFTAPDGTVRQVDVWGANSLRVRIAPAGSAIVAVPPAQGLLASPPAGGSPAVLRDDGLRLSNGNIELTLDAASGLATITRVHDGAVLLAETHATVDTPAAPTLPAGSDLRVTPTSTAALGFHGLRVSEGLYGFGEHRGSTRCVDNCTNTSLPIQSWDWRIEASQDLRVLPSNGNAWIPFYQSSRGYGFLWNSASYGSVHLGRDAIKWTSNATVQLDYWVTTTPAPAPAAPAVAGASAPAPPPPYAALMAAYAAATGPPPPLPFAYTGFWQCKLRYSSQFQIARIAQEYKDRGLPISVIVIDFHHWVHDGDWRFSDDAAVPQHTVGCWPNPANMTSTLRALGIIAAVSVWPDVDVQSINYGNMSSPPTMLIRGATGVPGLSQQQKYFLDAFNPTTRAYLNGQLQQGYGRYGIDTFWLDATEPQGANVGNWFYRLDADTHGGPDHADREVGMAWVQQYHRGIREGLELQHRRKQQQQQQEKKEDNDEQRKPAATTTTDGGCGGGGGSSSSNSSRSSFNDDRSSSALAPFLTRSAFAGSQRYGAILWSGDIESSFDELAVQVQVAQHVAMSGIYRKHPFPCSASAVACSLTCSPAGSPALCAGLHVCLHMPRKTHQEALFRAPPPPSPCAVWTTDIGGFKGGNTSDPVMRELIVRWFQ